MSRHHLPCNNNCKSSSLKVDFSFGSGPLANHPFCNASRQSSRDSPYFQCEWLYKNAGSRMECHHWPIPTYSFWTDFCGELNKANSCFRCGQSIWCLGVVRSCDCCNEKGEGVGTGSWLGWCCTENHSWCLGSWRSELLILSTRPIPCCYFPKGTTVASRQLHGYSDTTSTYAWTDSMIVLSWLTGNPRR